MGFVVGLGVIIICVICLCVLSKKEASPDNSGSENNRGNTSIENNEECNNIENNEDKNAYNIQRIADDVHFIKTVVLVYVIFTVIGVLIFIGSLSH